MIEAAINLVWMFTFFIVCCGYLWVAMLIFKALWIAWIHTWKDIVRERRLAEHFEKAVTDDLERAMR